MFEPLCTTIVWSNPEFCVQTLAPYLQRDIKWLEKYSSWPSKWWPTDSAKTMRKWSATSLYSLSDASARAVSYSRGSRAWKIFRVQNVKNWLQISNSGMRMHCPRMQKSSKGPQVKARFLVNKTTPLWDRLPGQDVDRPKATQYFSWSEMYLELSQWANFMSKCKMYLLHLILQPILCAL